MSSTPAATDQPEAPSQYEIRLQGRLDDQWSTWFGGLTLTRTDQGETSLTGTIVDQAALHSLLRKVRDLGLPLLSVSRIEPGPAGTTTPKP